MLNLLNAGFVRGLFATQLEDVIEAGNPDMGEAEAFAAAEAKLIKVLDAMLAFSGPLEAITDALIAVTVHQAIGAIDTPEERAELREKLAGIGPALKARRARVKAARAARREE
jgi:hypothetical protein